MNKGPFKHNHNHKMRLLALGMAAVLSVCQLPLGLGLPVCADELDEDMGPEGDSDLSQGGGSLDGPGGGSLFEDSGEDIQNTAGVDMDDLQEAIQSGDAAALRRFADAGALTGGTNTKSGKGIGTGAYRGMPDEDSEEDAEDDPDDSDKDFNMEDDPDAEKETELVEKVGVLEGADPDRIDQELTDLAEFDSTTGSDDELSAAEYIMSRMQNLGYTVQTQSFHEGFVDEEGVDRQGMNILAERGADSKKNRKSDIFLLVTHYDTKRNPEADDPYAQDRTGVCVLLEAGRILSSVVTDTDICFLFLSGETDGLYGAGSFLNSLSEENRARIKGVLDVERIGYDPETAYVLATLDGEGNSLGDLLAETGTRYEEAMQDRETDGEEADEGPEIALDGPQDGSDGRGSGPSDREAGESLGDGRDSQGEADSPDPAAAGGETELSYEADAIPDSWTYLADQTLSHAPFAQDAMTAVALTQYMAESEDTEGETEGEPDQEAAWEEAGEDSETSEDTWTDFAESPEETGPEPEEGPDAEEETEEWLTYDPSVPLPDADLIAEVTNIVAQAVSSIMDPNS